MVSGRVWIGVCITDTVRLPGTDSTRKRGRVIYFRRDRPRPPNVPNMPEAALRLVEEGVAARFAKNKKTKVVGVYVGGDELQLLDRMAQSNGKALGRRLDGGPTTETLVRRARWLQAKYRAQLAGPRARHPIRRLRVSVDVPAGIAWYVPLVTDDAPVVTRFRDLVGAKGDVPEFVKAAMARWDPLALLWLEDPDLARDLADDRELRAAALPVPGTWPRIKDEAARVIDLVVQSSALCKNEQSPIATGADLHDAPLWSYLPYRWEKGRYELAAWGTAPTDVPAAAAARLFPDAPCVYASQRMYALARAVLSAAYERLGKPVPPTPLPHPGAAGAGAGPWYMGKPLTYYAMRMLFGVARVAWSGSVDAQKLHEAHATLVGLYPSVFIWP